MAVAFDAISGPAFAFPSTSATQSHTPVGTPTAAAILLYHVNVNAQTVASATYGGVACSLEVTEDDAAFNRVQIWGLANPPAGTQNGVVTMTGADFFGVAVLTVTGSSTSVCFSGSAHAKGNSTAPSVTCPSSTGELVIDMSLGQVATMNVGSGQTELLNALQSSWHYASSYEAGAASVVMDWATSGALWSDVAASFALPAASAIKTFTGLANASTKQVIAVANASLKTFNGVANT